MCFPDIIRTWMFAWMSETGSYNYFDLRHVDTAMMSRCTMCRMRKCMTLVSPSGSPPCLIHQTFSAVLPSPQWYFYKRHTCRQQSTMLAPAPTPNMSNMGQWWGGGGWKHQKDCISFPLGCLLVLEAKVGAVRIMWTILNECRMSHQ